MCDKKRGLIMALASNRICRGSKVDEGGLLVETFVIITFGLTVILVIRVVDFHEP